MQQFPWCRADLETFVFSTKREHTGNPAAEASDLGNAIARALAGLQAEVPGPADDAAKFQIELLQDPQLAAPCWHLISNHASADGAWAAILDQYIENHHSHDDPLVMARAMDFEAIKTRVLRHLHNSDM